MNHELAFKTATEKAEEYVAPILEENHNKTYGFGLYDIQVGYIDGYREGFKDGYDAGVELGRKTPTDEMIIKIITLYNNFGCDKIDSNFGILSIDTIKEKLYAEYEK